MAGEMRRITIPSEWIHRAIDPTTPGSHILGPVRVDWPELQLTEEQIVANAVALAYGQRSPYPDLAIFGVEIPRVRVVLK